MTFIITLLIKASISLLLSAILLFLFRKASASLRHWIISLSLVGLLVLPFSSNFMPRWEVETPLALAEQQVTSAPKAEVLTPLATSVSEIRQAATGEDINTTNSTQLPPTQPLITSPNSLFTWPIFVFAIWLSISLFFLLRLYRGIRQTNRLRAESLPFEGPTRLSTDIPIRCHPAIRSPMTYGIRRPIILLPSVAKNWSAETLQVVLLHEMTHIKRRDYAVHLISWISLSLYWLPIVVDHLIHTPPDQQSWMHISSTHPVFKKYRSITQKRFKSYRDLPSHELIQHTQQKQDSKEEYPPFDFSSVPVLTTVLPPTATQEDAKEWGGFRLGKAHSGGNRIQVGQKFGRVIRGIPSGTSLKDFNFYLRYNDFEKLSFELSLYQLLGGEF